MPDPLTSWFLLPPWAQSKTNYGVGFVCWWCVVSGLYSQGWEDGDQMVAGLPIARWAPIHENYSWFWAGSHKIGWQSWTRFFLLLIQNYMDFICDIGTMLFKEFRTVRKRSLEVALPLVKYVGADVERLKPFFMLQVWLSVCQSARLPVCPFVKDLFLVTCLYVYLVLECGRFFASIPRAIFPPSSSISYSNFTKVNFFSLDRCFSLAGLSAIYIANTEARNRCDPLSISKWSLTFLPWSSSSPYTRAQGRKKFPS